MSNELPALNEALKARSQQPVPPPPAKVAGNEDRFGHGDIAARLGDSNEPGSHGVVPADLRLLH